MNRKKNGFGFICLIALMLSGIVGAHLTSSDSPFKVYPSSDRASIESHVSSQGNSSVPLKDNFAFRYRKGISEDSQSFVKHYKGTGKSLHVNDNNNKVAHSLTQLLVFCEELPDGILSSHPCFLRAPPVLAINS